MPAAIHIGTSGWVYPHWRESFYPVGMAQTRWLEFYTQQFDATEINASFYRLPSKTTVEAWQKRVGRHFYFCPKISRFITHAKKLNDPEQSVPRFFDVFGLLKRQLGPVLIQLPAALAYHEEKATIFFGFLRKHYPDFSYALEARHLSWTQPQAEALLKRYDIGWVIADSGGRFASARLVTARHIYLRFHGPDGSYATPYTRRQLAAYAAKCRRWREEGYSVWAFFNNDVHGHAPRDARTLKELTA